MSLLLLVGFAQTELLRSVDAERGIEIGALVQTVGGEAVFSWRPEEARVLASNTKLFTTAAALCTLSPDWRWTTTLHWNGAELWVQGGGDPALRATDAGDFAADFLDQTAAWLQQKGVRLVESLVLDDRLWPGPTRHPLWPEDQWQQVWCAPISSLSVQGNCLVLDYPAHGPLQVQPPLGKDLRPKFRPTHRPQFSAWWSESGRLHVRGDEARDGSVTLAVRDPRPIFASWLVHGLENRGISVASRRWAGNADPVAPGPYQGVSGVETKAIPSAWTLADAIVVANKDSDNFVAESLLRTLAVARGFVGTPAGGLEAMVSALAAADVPGPLALVDGSGLARQPSSPVNLASPKVVCALLRGMAHHAEGGIYFDSLPIGGALPGPRVSAPALACQDRLDSGRQQSVRLFVGLGGCHFGLFHPHQLQKR